MLMQRRRTDPKTALLVLCEPAQSKCTSTFQKSHFIQKCSGKMPPQTRGPHFVRACAVEMRFNISQENLFFFWNFTGKMPRPRTQDHTLLESAQSKCTSTFHNSNFLRKFTGKAWAQKLGPHFVQACAVEMHFNISQQPLLRKFSGKMFGPRTKDHTLCAPAQSKYTSTFHKSNFLQKFTGKMLGPRTQDHTLCEPAQSKCTSIIHKSHLIRKFTG